jgi:hypothetical protein
MPRVNETPSDEPDDELTDRNEYVPYYLDHDPWTEYEAHDALGRARTSRRSRGPALRNDARAAER